MGEISALHFRTAELVDDKVGVRHGIILPPPASAGDTILAVPTSMKLPPGVPFRYLFRR